MTLKRVNRLVWIIVGLSLAFLVWGGLGATRVASSSAHENPSLISQAEARLAPGMSYAPGILGIDATKTPNPETRTYVVEPGDSLWTIAVKFYGNGAKYPLILQANDLPDNTRLQVGQVLVIPYPETEKAPTVRAPTVVSPTPSLTPIIVPPTPVILPSAIPTNEPVVRATPTNVPDPVATSSDAGMASVMPVLGVVVNVLGAICLFGSLLCAALSYDLYRRSRHYARRRYIGNRVRAGLQ